MCGESRGTGFDKCKQVANIGSEKKVYKNISVIVICKYKIWDSCDGGMARPTCMCPLEYRIYVLIILYVKFRMRVYDFLQRELVCSSVFIYDQFCIWSDHARGLIIISTRPLLSGHAV